MPYLVNCCSWSCSANCSNCRSISFLLQIVDPTIFFLSKHCKFWSGSFLLQDLPIVVLGNFLKILQNFVLDHFNLLEAEFRNNICHGEGSRMHVFANTGLLFDTSFTMLFDSLSGSSKTTLCCKQDTASTRDSCVMRHCASGLQWSCRAFYVLIKT